VFIIVIVCGDDCPTLSVYRHFYFFCFVRFKSLPAHHQIASETAQLSANNQQSSYEGADRAVSSVSTTEKQPEVSSEAIPPRKYEHSMHKNPEGQNAIPRDLEAVVAAWPELPAAVKAGIVAMVRASKPQ
jgi:hypothetical protein